MIYLLRFLLALQVGRETPVTHEQAHVLCETLVYALVAPDVADDATTAAGEVVAKALCRVDE